MSERARHTWTVVDSADGSRGVATLEHCDCGEWRATIRFSAPQGPWVNLRGFLNDLDQLGIEYAVAPEAAS
jgi:hypothetical protein